MVPAISAENLGKCYHLQPGAPRSSYRTLRESVMDLVGAPWRAWSKDRKGRKKRDFWALDNVNFQVPPGEVVGVIGRNGAGKSTLLKILSRITRPTCGQVRLQGRVGSLLEVGTGFHPELSGRENIFLNGAILGMARGEINKKFADIVDFAGLETFLDTPVKRYSSGMYMRLAFSVAAHINPEILLIDEVLAVGDMAFQKKCLGKMEEVARGGRTILFVSHQMDALLNLCSTSLLLDQGRLIMQGPTEKVVERYFQSQQALLGTPLHQRQDHLGLQHFRFTETWMEDLQGQRLPSALTGQGIKLVVTYQVAAGVRISRPAISFAIYTSQGLPVTRLTNVAAGEAFPDPVPPQGRIECLIPRLPLNVGRYYYNVLAETGPDFEMEDWVQGAGWITVEPGDFWGTGKGIEAKFPMLADQRWELHGQ